METQTNSIKYILLQHVLLLLFFRATERAMHNPAMVNLPRAVPIALTPFGRMQPASDFIPIDVSQQVLQVGNHARVGGFF